MSETTGKTKSERITIRLHNLHGRRLSRVEKISRRTRTSLIEECLEAQLPALEAQYRNFKRKAA